MDALRVVQEPYGWTLRLGDDAIGLFHSKLDAVGHANWLQGQLRLDGERAEVRVESTPTATACA